MVILLAAQSNEWILLLDWLLLALQPQHYLQWHMSRQEQMWVPYIALPRVMATE